MKKWYLLLGALISIDFLFLLFLWRDLTFKEGKTAVNKVTPKVSTPSLPEDTSIRLMLLGDIMLGRTVNTTSLDKNDPVYPFRKVSERLNQADIVFANLESPVTYDCPRIESGYFFCGNLKMVEGLTFSGIDVVSIANNHSHNFGPKGFEETKKILEKNNISWVGDMNLKIIEKNGVKFGFLGFDRSQQEHPKLTIEETELIKDADLKSDLLVVGMHWGTEYQDKALPGVRMLAKELVKNGADIVSGHHPHWVQDIKYIDPSRNFNEFEEFCTQCKPVYYSLGNFIFDQMWSEKTRKGLVVEITIEKSSIVKEERLDTYMKEWAQPEWKYSDSQYH